LTNELYRSKAKSNNPVNGQATESRTGDQNSASTTAVLASSTSLAPGHTYAPVPPSEVDLVGVSCPPKPVNILLLHFNATFACTSDTDYVGKDITGLVAYTLKQCLQFCVLASTGHQCVAVSYSGNMKQEFKAWGANCWLKTDTSGEKSTPGWTGWKLVTQS
jgi:hypothetical protein